MNWQPIKNRFYSHIILAMILTLLVSCSNSIESGADLLRWINQEENGLVKKKNINGFVLTAKYLPPHYLAWQETKNQQFSNYQCDSILNHYTNFRTFLLTIAPDAEREQSDIMFYDVVNKSDYKNRVQDLNFNIKSFISLHTDTDEFFPVLHTLENTYELAKHKTIYIVFADNNSTQDLLTSKKIDLKFSDELFDTGISHFVFDKNELDAISRMDIKLYN